MSQKRNRRPHKKSAAPGRDPKQLQQSRKTRRIPPLTRNLLLLAVVLLAAGELMERLDWISTGLENGMAAVALVATVLALAALMRDESKLKK